ncbi:hypothetical protein D3C87_1670450 [compost metagenome]
MVALGEQEREFRRENVHRRFNQMIHHLLLFGYPVETVAVENHEIVVFGITGVAVAVQQLRDDLRPIVNIIEYHHFELILILSPGFETV